MRGRTLPACSTSSANVLPARSSRSVVCRSRRGRPGFNQEPLGEGLLLGGEESILLGGRERSSEPRTPQKLVLPGQNAPPRGGGRLVLPVDKAVEKALLAGAEKLGPEIVTPTGPNSYRPPAGFMNDTPDDNSEITSMPIDTMLNKLRSRAGMWHNLAKMFPALAKAGYDNRTVDEITGITPVEQNRWMVAATVYDSLVASRQMSEEQLSNFDGLNAADLLYPFRFLNQEMRLQAAQYILDQNLDATACEVLARSMKEWERRPLERAGYSNKPGDCMAFKYERDALECRKVEDAQAYMIKALEAAVTETAVKRLEATLSELLGTDKDESLEAGGLASLLVLRLSPDDIGFRPIPVLGTLGQVSLSTITSAPKTSQDGAFGAFAIDGTGFSCKWVALPQWKALAMMRHPVALAVDDCSTISAIIEGVKPKTDEDYRRLTGAGLVVSDVMDTPSDDVDQGTYYLAVPEGAGAGSKLELVEGIRVRSRGLVAVATVSFVARPPQREQAPLTASSNDSLLQL